MTSFQLPTEIIDDGHIALLGLEAFAVYCCMKRHYPQTPSLGEIAKVTNLPIKQAGKACVMLCQLGYLQTEEVKETGNDGNDGTH